MTRTGTGCRAPTLRAAPAGYEAQDRMTAYGAATYTYGPNGDLRTRTAGGQTTTYSYDALGNLMEVLLPDGRAIMYVVDGLNRRVGEKVNGALVEGFLYDGQLRPVAWLDGTGAVKATFVYGLHVNVPEYMNTTSGTFRFVHDHLGSGPHRRGRPSGRAGWRHRGRGAERGGTRPPPRPTAAG